MKVKIILSNEDAKRLNRPKVIMDSLDNLFGKGADWTIFELESKFRFPPGTLIDGYKQVDYPNLELVVILPAE